MIGDEEEVVTTDSKQENYLWLLFILPLSKEYVEKTFTSYM